MIGLSTQCFTWNTLEPIETNFLTATAVIRNLLGKSE